MGRVRIGTCSGPAEAALVRAAFEAHDIPVLINAEQHASMLGGLGGAFVPLHVLVDEQDAEEAAELLRDLRDQPAQALDTEDDDDDEPDSAESIGASGVGERVDRRKRTGVVLLLAFCITFGTAHMYTRAWVRGFMLLGLEVFSFRMLAKDQRLGGLLLVGCIFADLVGALIRVRATKATIPQARVRQ